MSSNTSRQENFWNTPLTVALQKLNVDAKQGLSSDEVQKRLKLYGPNSATNVGRSPLWLQFLMRFRNPLVILLLVASGLSALTGDVPSFLIIASIVLLSVTFGFVQEVRAEKSVDALRRSVAVKASVIRDGISISIPLEQLVPGDIVELSGGVLVPADGILITAKDIYVNQALLTGESFPVEKQVGDLKVETDDITEAFNAVFMGTSIISGNGTMVVLNTGKDTHLGQLAGSLALTHPPTDYERGIEKFGMLILRIAILMVLFVLLVNILFHRPMLESFLFALALAVGLTPELLPMLVTITLSRGAIRMAKESVIVKHLPAMHNLGAMNILCTDKTGTLTEAKINLEKTLDADWNESYRVFMLTYLNSFFESGLKSALDQAIIDSNKPDISTWRKIDEVPFDFERKRVSVLVTSAEETLLIVKGAPEEILKLCTNYENSAGEIQILSSSKMAECKTKFEALSEEGFRVLAVAFRKVANDCTSANITDEADLIFLGFAIFMDPPKIDAAETIVNLANDGITVKIISGDNELVTRHICKVLNFDTGEIIIGSELEKLSDEALQARIETTHAYCRITPQQKSRIIAAYQRSAHTVGFLGDGINDAEALHIADVGISVDSAADPAKEAADVILLKHDLSVIQNGVIEGRRAVINTQKYILMASSSNFGNMFSMAGAALILPFLPMLPLQILLNNLLYDVSQTAIPFDNVEKEALAKPIHWKIHHIKRFMGVLGPVSSIFDFLTFYVLIAIFNASEILFHTGWFVESLVTQVLIIFSIRTAKPMFSSKPNWLVVAMAIATSAIAVILPFTPLNTLLGFSPLPAQFFVFLAIALIAYFMLVEIVKYIFRKYLAMY